MEFFSGIFNTGALVLHTCFPGNFDETCIFMGLYLNFRKALFSFPAHLQEAMTTMQFRIPVFLISPSQANAL